MKVKIKKFQEVRNAHHREKAEDYAEMIFELIETEGEARLTDVAKCFGVTPVTAHKIVDRLQREGLVRSEPYRTLFLTPLGKRIAMKSRKRHEIVHRMLRALGVPEHIAHIDAEGIEHRVSHETLNAFERFLQKGKK